MHASKKIHASRVDESHRGVFPRRWFCTIGFAGPFSSPGFEAAHLLQVFATRLRAWVSPTRRLLPQSPQSPKAFARGQGSLLREPYAKQALTQGFQPHDNRPCSAVTPSVRTQSHPICRLFVAACLSEPHRGRPCGSFSSLKNPFARMELQSSQEPHLLDLGLSPGHESILS